MADAIWKRLEARRKLKGLTIQEMVDALGVTKQTWYNRAEGESRWSDAELERAAKALGTDVQTLRYGELQALGLSAENAKHLENSMAAVLTAMKKAGLSPASVPPERMAKMVGMVYANAELCGMVDDALAANLVALVVT